ncbi:MAG: DUF5317 domain-containing protein [Thermoflexaceae bacterium]|nr:DUF5317 domain-containing protein [Thermoflexaceae bacterium]
MVQQFAIRGLGEGDIETGARRAVFFATTAALCLLALRFRRIHGAWLISAGIFLNLVPMAAHGGLMPIALETVEASGHFPEITTNDVGKPIPYSKDIVLAREDIWFEPLSDRYSVSLPGYGGNIYSIGDFVLFAGLGAAAIQLAIPTRTRRAERQTARRPGRARPGWGGPCRSRRAGSSIGLTAIASRANTSTVPCERACPCVRGAANRRSANGKRA